jgi:hypothetical protein
VVILDTTTRKGKEMLINMNPQPNGDMHYAHRFSYTHTDGTICEAEWCYIGSHKKLEEFLGRSRGIAKVDTTSIPVWHNSLCQNMGEVEGERHRNPREIKWSRSE